MKISESYFYANKYRTQFFPGLEILPEHLTARESKVLISS
jgi:hypothetical protein